MTLSLRRLAAVALVLTTLTLSSTLSAAFASGSPIVFGTPVNVSNDKGTSIFPEIAADGSSVYVAWHGHVNHGTHVLFAASHDNGTTYGAPIVMDTGPGPSSPFAIAANGTDVYVAYVDNSTLVSELYIRSSQDGGNTWSAPFLLAPSPLYNSGQPQIAACGTHIYATWMNITTGGIQAGGLSQMFFRTSANAGSTWGPVLNLQGKKEDGTVAKGNEQEVRCSGSNVYVIYADWALGYRSVFLRESNNYGATFANYVDLSMLGGVGRIREPNLAVAGSKLYAYWNYALCSSCNLQSVVRYSPDNGVTWSKIMDPENDSYGDHEPFMAASGNMAYIVTHEFTLSGGRITKLYFRAFNSTSGQWGPKIDVTGLSERQGNTYANIDATGKWVFISWSDIEDATSQNPSNWEMFFVSSSDYGATFSSQQNISNNLGSSGVVTYGKVGSYMAITPTHVYVAWNDNSTSNGNFDILLASGTIPS